MNQNNSDIISNNPFSGKIDVTSNTRVYTNTEQELIVITKDKLKLELIESANLFSSKKGWITPFSLLITIVVTLTTADFKEFVFDPKIWTALFVFTGITCFIWLCIELYKLFMNWNKGGVDYLINKLTKEENKK